MNYFVTDSINKDDISNNNKLHYLKNSTNLNWENLNYSMNSRGGRFQLIFNRQIKPFFIGLKILKKRKEINNIIFLQQFFGICFAFWCKLFKVKKNFNVEIITFIYKEKKGLIGKLYKKFINFAVNSGYIDKIICFSKYEKEYYIKLFNTKIFKNINLGIEDLSNQYMNEYKKGDFFLAVGRSNRDYEFLKTNYNYSKKLIILCNAIDSNVENKNIEIYNNVFGKDYLKLLSKCFGVIIPLKDVNVSSGQLVMLQAMMMKKPIIITKANTINDYVKNDFNSIIIDKTKESLDNAIMKLENEEYYEKLISNGRKFFMDNFTEEQMMNEIGKEMLKIE